MRRLRYVIIGLFGLSVLWSASRVLTPTITLPPTAWGNIILIADVPSVEAPALWADDDGVWGAWTAVTQGAVRHMAQRPPHVNTTILALDAFYPMHYRLLPAYDGMHWLWLDRTPDTDQLRLQSSRVSAGLVAQINPVVISSALTVQYDVVGLPNQGAQVLWSEGSGENSQLQGATLDPLGRVVYADVFAVEGSLPALVRDNLGIIWAFWVARGQVLRAQWGANGFEYITRLFPLPPLATDEQVVRLIVAMDATRTYALLQTLNAQQQPRLWITSGGTVATTWSNPRPLAIATHSASVQTSFTVGTVRGARWGTQAIGWASPLRGQYDSLPIAVTLGDRLGVLYVKNGEPIGYQELTTVGSLLDAPTIAQDRDGHLTVAWSQPRDENGASLWLTTSKTP